MRAKIVREVSNQRNAKDDWIIYEQTQWSFTHHSYSSCIIRHQKSILPKREGKQQQSVAMHVVWWLEKQAAFALLAAFRIFQAIEQQCNLQLNQIRCNQSPNQTKSDAIDHQSSNQSKTIQPNQTKSDAINHQSPITKPSQMQSIINHQTKANQSKTIQPNACHSPSEVRRKDCPKKSTMSNSHHEFRLR